MMIKKKKKKKKKLPVHLQRLIFCLFRGREQGTAEHRLVAVFKCLSEHALSHASLAGQ